MLRPGASDAAEEPKVRGFYTLSMASEASVVLAKVLGVKLPKYPSPVALIGRLAVDRRVRGRRLGELLLVDALRRVAVAADMVGCVGTVVDAKDEQAARFYAKYGFLGLGDGVDGWPRRMFLAMSATPVGVGRTGR